MRCPAPGIAVTSRQVERRQDCTTQTMDNSENPLRRIFLDALEIQGVQERALFLSRACGSDSMLRREVEELLRANAEAGQFLPEQPATSAARGALLGAAEALSQSGALRRSSTAGPGFGPRNRRLSLVDSLLVLVAGEPGVTSSLRGTCSEHASCKVRLRHRVVFFQ